MEREAPRDLEILAERARTDQVTQRRLAARPSIALGLTNLNRKRLARTGFINSSWYGTEEAAEPALLTLRKVDWKGRPSSGGHRENHVPGLAGAAPPASSPGRGAAADRGQLHADVVARLRAQGLSATQIVTLHA
jgi:hypothetical protein